MGLHRIAVQPHVCVVCVVVESGSGVVVVGVPESSHRSAARPHPCDAGVVLLCVEGVVAVRYALWSLGCVVSCRCVGAVGVMGVVGGCVGRSGL